MSSARLSAREFRFVCDHVFAYSRIILDSNKLYLAYSRLGPLVRQMGLRSLGHLVAELKAAPDSELGYQVVEALTTNETWFFRDQAVFESLREYIIPDLIRRRRDQRSLRIWLAACSSGQEAYSLLMLLRESFPSLFSDCRLTIRGSDLSLAMVARSKAGLYSQHEVDRGLDRARLDLHFEKEGAGWRIRPELRHRVDFKQENLAQSFRMPGPWDLVFLRNVLIYIDESARRDILGRVYDVMSFDGYLAMGATESPIAIRPDRFRRSSHRPFCRPKPKFDEPHELT